MSRPLPAGVNLQRTVTTSVVVLTCMSEESKVAFSTMVLDADYCLDAPEFMPAGSYQSNAEGQLVMPHVRRFD